MFEFEKLGKQEKLNCFVKFVEDMNLDFVLLFIFVEDFFKFVVKNIIVVDEFLVLIKMNFGICWVLNQLDDMILCL